MDARTADVIARIDREKATYLDELREFLRIPSISTDPAYAADVRRAAEFIRSQLTTAGLNAELIETDSSG